MSYRSRSFQDRLVPLGHEVIGPKSVNVADTREYLFIHQAGFRVKTHGLLFIPGIHRESHHCNDKTCGYNAHNDKRELPLHREGYYKRSHESRHGLDNQAKFLRNAAIYKVTIGSNLTSDGACLRRIEGTDFLAENRLQEAHSEVLRCADCGERNEDLETLANYAISQD